MQNTIKLPMKCHLLLFFTLLPLTAYLQPYDAELISKKTLITITQGKMLTEEKVVLQINNRSGEKYAKIGVPYSRLSKLKGLDVWLTDSHDNVIRKIRNNEVITRSLFSAISFYSDRMVKEVTPRHHIFPYRIVYTYQIESKQFFHIADWYPLITPELPAKNATLELNVPKDYKIFYREQKIEPAQFEFFDDRALYKWEASFQEVKRPEIYSEPVQMTLPNVRIVPEGFMYEMPGSLNSWKSFGQWIYKLNTMAMDLSDQDKHRIRQSVSHLDNDREKIKFLYHQLQEQTRYVNISIETGGLIPFPASFTMQNKYGDCKALTVYMMAMLEATGIKSFYSLVYAGKNPLMIDKDFPSQQFNHTFLMIPLEGDTIWLECTSKDPFGYMGPFTQNRDVLVIDPEGSYFLKTPPLSPEETLHTRHIIIEQESRNRSQLVMNSIFSGELYEMFRYLNTNLSRNDQNRIVREYLNLPGFEIVDYVIDQPDGQKAEMSFRIHANSEEHFKTPGINLIFKPPAFDIPLFEPPSRRNQQVKINFPINLFDTITYVLLDKKREPHKPQMTRIESPFGYYSLRTHETDRGIDVIKRFLLVPGTYHTDLYQQFYDFITKVRRTEEENDILIRYK
jgi:hypothetical protein